MALFRIYSGNGVGLKRTAIVDSSPYLVFAPLNPTHDRTGFQCGVEALGRYLKKQAKQDFKRTLAVSDQIALYVICTDHYCRKPLLRDLQASRYEHTQSKNPTPRGQLWSTP
jgi:hypothetical protein